jgi:hypothetical protein
MVPSGKRASSYSPSLLTMMPPLLSLPGPVGLIQASMVSASVMRSEAESGTRASGALPKKQSEPLV